MSDFDSTTIYDVLVAGTGMAGWTAARRAQQLGLRVVAADKGDGPGSSNARMSGGFMNAAYVGIREKPDVLKAYAEEVTSGLARKELVEVWAENCSRTIDWLAGEDIIAGLLPERRDRLYILPFRLTPQGLAEYDRERGPDKAMTSHAARFVEQGGLYMPNSRVIDLLVDSDGRVSGAKIETPDGISEIRARNVVLSDGGFQANPELLRKYVGPQADKMKLRSMSSQTGDGLAMALKLGAAVDNMNYFYGHMLHLDSLTNDGLWPYPILDGIISDGILVNRQGRRFVNEQITGEGMSRLALSGVGVTNAVGQGDDPRGAFVILDAESWKRQGWDKDRGEFRGTKPANDTILEAGGTVYKADSLVELARQADIDPHGLVATVEAFNAAATVGKAAGLPVPRSGKPDPLTIAPFYAVPSVAGITFTLGGVRINRNGQVQHENGHAIPGLYAAGGTAGGLGGGPRGGYLGGLACATVFGLICAEHIAATKAA
ncbi:FAD-binding protein [Rhizobium lusitanum]|uniref:FAD-binding protein n=1 Tax=Rhizobium lusitanum TaxID=293958 RepID=A0A6L9UAU8_9HYPH|nr:FAD-dependent oxidoreductase [Rhizobium lusitanum]NEI72421.1 FAD-binding protein [Rhizobium lusitanum]